MFHCGRPWSDGVPSPTRRAHGAEEIDIDQMAELADGFPVVPTLLTRGNGKGGVVWGADRGSE